MTFSFDVNPFDTGAPATGGSNVRAMHSWMKVMGAAAGRNPQPGLENPNELGEDKTPDYGDVK